MRLSFEFANLLGAVYHRGTIKFAPDNRTLLSPVGNKIIVHDLRSTKSSALPLQVNYNIHRVCIHPNSTIALAASERSHLYMVSLTSGKQLHLKEYKSFAKISHISFSPDGRYYCVCGDNTCLIYITPGSLIAGKGREITPFRLFKKLRVNHDTILDVSWSNDSCYMCIASNDMSLNIVDLLDKGRAVLQLRGHTDTILNCYFANTYPSERRFYSLSKGCQLFVWDEKEGHDAASTNDDAPSGANETKIKTENDDEESTRKRSHRALKFYRSAKHYVRLPNEADETKEERLRKSTAYLTSSDYCSNAKILVLGYNTGHYSLLEMPSGALLHNLSSNYGSIDSVSINKIGDWIALGSSVDPEVDAANRSSNRTQSRLLVWEWQSKSHVLDAVGSGATMSNLHECVSYSLDGTHLVSGNLAGRIKVWSQLTGETVATFGDEHKGPIKAIKFVPNKSGKVIVSASLDGTVRAYDLNKYKNFRTFQSPIPEKRPEFISLDVDCTGEFIAAGTYNYFEIYLYSLQTGKFLEYLTGHEGPVSGVSFSPNSNLLVSSSWDKTARIWNLFEGSKCLRDTITLSHELITVAFRPDGNQFAVSLSNGQIALFNPHTADQLGAPIEGASDLGATQLIGEVSRDSNKYFIALSYSADGSYLIGGGKSNFVCIYHAQEKILLKKIAITFNMSMDGVFDYVSSRKRSEFGFNLELLDRRREERTVKPVQLPGVRKGDLGERAAKPVIAVTQVAFSPTMRAFAAATTEGVLVYSLDVARHFDPYKLVVGVDPGSVRRALLTRDFGLALVQSVQLNNQDLFREALERTPAEQVDAIVSNLEVEYAKRMLDLIGRLMVETRHIEHYLLWAKKLLYRHGVALKSMKNDEIAPIIRSLHQSTNRCFLDLKKNCDYARFSLEYLTRSHRSLALEDGEEVLMTVG